ncbi:MAG: hypothetical protein ACI93T_003331 [Porticoccaceae bacterium]|jgi:hypothetical protein
MLSRNQERRRQHQNVRQPPVSAECPNLSPTKCTKRKAIIGSLHEPPCLALRHLNGIRKWPCKLPNAASRGEVQVHVDFPRLVVETAPRRRHERRHGVLVKQVTDERAKLHERATIRSVPPLRLASPVSTTFGHADAGLDDSFDRISRSASSIRHRLEQPRRRSDSRHQTPVRAATFTLLGSRFTNQLVKPAFRADLPKVRRHDGSSNVKAQTNSGRRHRLAGCMKWLENRQRVSSGTRCSHSETLIHGSRPSDCLCSSVGRPEAGRRCACGHART